MWSWGGIGRSFGSVSPRSLPRAANAGAFRSSGTGALRNASPLISCRGSPNARSRLTPDAMEASAANASAVVNALTIDVEDYFQVSAFAPYIARSTWEERPCRVEQNIDRILELLSTTGVHATFFTLGWIAERYPQMVRRIVSGGHELASHGYAHERASALEADAFFADVALAKAVLEDIAGTRVQGYRAPSFSIGDQNRWAYACLAKAGYRYSSSVYPIRHDHYGSPNGSRFAHMAHTQVLEVPIATARVFPTNLPAGGGEYFRRLPYCWSCCLHRRGNRCDPHSALF